MTNLDQGSTPDPRSRRAGPKTMTDLLALPDPERTLLNWLVRQRGASLPDIAAHTAMDMPAAQTMADQLVTAGFLTCDRTAEPNRYKPNLVSHKPRAVPDALWNALD